VSIVDGCDGMRSRAWCSRCHQDSHADQPAKAPPASSSPLIPGLCMGLVSCSLSGHEWPSLPALVRDRYLLSPHARAFGKATTANADWTRRTAKCYSTCTDTTGYRRRRPNSDPHASSQERVLCSLRKAFWTSAVPTQYTGQSSVQKRVTGMVRSGVELSSVRAAQFG